MKYKLSDETPLENSHFFSSMNQKEQMNNKKKKKQFMRTIASYNYYQIVLTYVLINAGL